MKKKANMNDKVNTNERGCPLVDAIASMLPRNMEKHVTVVEWNVRKSPDVMAKFNCPKFANPKNSTDMYMKYQKIGGVDIHSVYCRSFTLLNVFPSTLMIRIPMSSTAKAETR
jgi:hypothetical protein